MNSWSAIFYFSIVSAAMMLSMMGLLFVVAMPGSDRWSKRFFLYHFIALLACCVTCLIDMILVDHSNSNWATFFLMLVECLLLAVPIPMLMVYLLHCCGENIRTSRLLFIELGLYAVYIALLAGSRSIGIFSYYASYGWYDRGPRYSLLLLPVIAAMLVNLLSVVQRRKQLSRKIFLSFLVAILPVTVALFVQLFIDVLPFVDICYVLSAVVMYVLSLSDQIERDLRQQREITRQQQEIAHQRANIMVLQMRPHFIYNTMMSIYSLCNLDPQKARKVTMDFTNYLRKNFDAVASDSTIPFTAELEHTRAYLAVEQVQHEEMLVVEYDTPFTSFRVPPLTLQPLAENAVKHAMNPYAGPLHVTIRTRHTEAGSVITVEDNGPGFDPSDESKPHTTLENIRQRLEMMCGGRLTITSDDSGTLVEITIPDRSPE